jgi:hypothetical protein
MAPQHRYVRLGVSRLHSPPKTPFTFHVARRRSAGTTTAAKAASTTSSTLAESGAPNVSRDLDSCARKGGGYFGDESGVIMMRRRRRGVAVVMTQPAHAHERRRLCSGRQAHVPFADADLIVRRPLGRGTRCDCATRSQGAIATWASASLASHVPRRRRQRRRGDDERRRPQRGQREAVRRDAESQGSSRALAASPASDAAAR